jgi:hypothetical protein
MKIGVFWVVPPWGSFTRATRRNIPEDTILHSHHREILKFYTSASSFLTRVQTWLDIFRKSLERYLNFA